MNIPIHWRPITVETDEAWTQTRRLYAYLSARGTEILYVGMTWHATVRSRWSRSGKPYFWDDLEEQRGIHAHRVLVGGLALFPDERLTKHLLAEIESLLIHRLQPWGNIQCQRSRIVPSGLVVNCRGTSPHRLCTFRDQRWP
ncbi:MAG: hypothetical protein A3G75_13715 [Verrucomicrobia bacterium RIFCSPLOWO2_12_FULL_64_8]|nr:MAG: hypothetical protein A3G75_13715 [Verrucomicrobia bacterium RIFCSPLOWO2_12_FULL_64_8]